MANNPRAISAQLCNLLGKWVEDGEYPRDMETLKRIAEGVCYYNAKNYFGF